MFFIFESAKRFISTTMPKEISKMIATQSPAVR